MNRETAFKERIVSQDQGFPAEIFLRDSRNERLVAPLHWHDCLELLYVLEGCAQQWINDQLFNICQGDLIVLRDGDLHATTTEPEDAVRILVVKFLPDLLGDTYSRNVESVHVRAFLSRDNPRLLHLAEGNQDALELQGLLEKIHREWMEKRTAYELAVHGLLYGLVAALSRMGAFQGLAPLLPDKERVRLTSVLDKAVSMLPAVMTLKDAAGMMNYSYAHFSRYFQKATGGSFKAYMDFMRIREVERLALQQGLSLAECASRTGYPDATVFSRAYRRLRGQSAREMVGQKMKSQKVQS